MLKKNFEWHPKPAASAGLEKVAQGIDPSLRQLFGFNHDAMMAASTTIENLRKAAAPVEDPIVSFIKTQQRKAQGLAVEELSPLADLNLAKVLGTDGRWTSGVSLADQHVNKIADAQLAAMVEGYFAKRASTLEKTELATELERLVKGHEHLFDGDDAELAGKAIAALDFDACLKICRAARERNQLAA